MSQALSIAHAHSWNLATTLMVCIAVLHADNSEYGIMPSAEYDGGLPRTFMNSIPSNRKGAPVTSGGGGSSIQIPLPPFITFGYTRQRAAVVVEGAPARPLSRRKPP
jgi:hypothetical protein